MAAARNTQAETLRQEPSPFPKRPAFSG